MTDTVILRFRDVEAQTVELHQECIRATGGTWWAWWKKESEESPKIALRDLTALGAVDIGLINRQRNTRYLARCERVVATDSGERISSPEPVRTPDYYRDDSFPVWFLLSEIRRVNDTEWNQRLGGVPEGEPTIFVVPLDKPNIARKALRDKYDMTPVEVSTSTILHISDLHFGSDYGFPLIPRVQDSGHGVIICACSGPGFDLVAQDEIGAGVAGLSGGEVLTQLRNGCCGAPGG